jgi:hypothetical protein
MTANSSPMSRHLPGMGTTEHGVCPGGPVPLHSHDLSNGLRRK